MYVINEIVRALGSEKKCQRRSYDSLGSELLKDSVVQ